MEPTKPGPGPGQSKGPKIDADPRPAGPSALYGMDMDLYVRPGPHLPRTTTDSSPSSSFSMEPRIGPSSPWSSNPTATQPPVYSPLFPLQSFPADSPYPLRIPLEETLMLRQEHIPSVCTLHMEKSPLKLVRGLDQYVYDENGIEYLDCINNVAHVGHCNSVVVNAGKVAMATVGNISSSSGLTAFNYYQKLKTTFPHELDTFLFVSSGSEANDLALRLARLNSNGYDVVAVDGSYHGNLLSTNEISPKQFSLDHLMPGFFGPECIRKLADWVHVIPCPDLFHGKYDECSSNGSEKYNLDARKVIDDVVRSGKKIACFICEPIMTHAGVILPPEGWLSSVYNDIHAAGGLVIADETGCGLGRTGGDWWSFQYSNVVPDIVTLDSALWFFTGKPVGNGHPMALVVTRASIAAKLGVEILKYECNEVEAAIGLAVVDTIRSENLMKNARDVGSFLREGLKSLAASHPHIGHVGGVGLIVGVEVVHTRQNRKPAREIAEQILYKFKEHRMIVATDGLHKNVLLFCPPMCFDIANAHLVIVTLNNIMVEIEKEEPDFYSEQIYVNSSNAEIRPGGNRFRLEDYDDDEATQRLLAMD